MKTARILQIRPAPAPPAQAAKLAADYLAFDRRRIARRQYLKAFGGMAVLVLLGAVFGRVAAGEAEAVAALLLVPFAALAAAEWVQRHRLVRRLNRLRAETQG